MAPNTKKQPKHQDPRQHGAPAVMSVTMKKNCQDVQQKSMELILTKCIAAVGGHSFKTSDGESYELVKGMAQGGQGILALARNTSGDECIFKILIGNNLEQRFASIRELYAKKAALEKALCGKGFNIALPVSLYVSKNGIYGYVMKLLKGRSINSMMLDKCFTDMPYEKRVSLVHKLAEPLAFVHRFGFAYQDISHHNFLYDEATDTVSLIDPDNLAANSMVISGQRVFALGTGFYIAPEIAFGHNPSAASDSYSFAALAFEIMTGSTDSPYHGKELAKKLPLPVNMLDAVDYASQDPSYGEDWLYFVFDRSNRVNEIDPGCFLDPEKKEYSEMIVRNWSMISPEIKELFYRAFPFIHPGKMSEPEMTKRINGRPLASSWVYATRDAGEIAGADITAGIPKGALKLVMGRTSELIDSGSFTVLTKDGKSFGEIKKQGSGFTFTSMTQYGLRCLEGSGGTVKEIRKGDTVTLTNGMSIHFAGRPAKKITVYIGE